MKISADINPFSDIKIREFLKENSNLIKIYDRNALSDFFKEIISLESDIVLEELIKIPEIYKIKIKENNEDVFFFDYFVESIKDNSHSLVGKFINMNLDNLDFLIYHLNNKVDLLHILLRNGIVPNNKLLKKWNAINKTGKDISSLTSAPILSKKGISLLNNEGVLSYLEENIDYFTGEQILGDEFYQKEIMFNFFNSNYSSRFMFYFLDSIQILEFFRKIKKNTLLTNEFEIFINYLDDLNDIQKNKGNYTFRRTDSGIKIEEDRDILIRLKKMWFCLSGSTLKRERDLNYMIDSLNYFSNKTEIALNYIKNIREELESISNIINTEDESTIEKKKKRI